MQARARRRWVAGLVVLAALVGLYAAAGFFLVPYFVKRELAGYAGQIGRRAEAREIRFNPFTYALEAEGVALRETSGAPIATMERLRIDFEFTSLFRRGWHFSELRLDGADIHVEIGRDGRLNLAQLANDMTKGKTKGETKPADQGPAPAVSVESVAIEKTTVHFADRSQPQPVTAVLGPLSVHASHLSTVAGESGQYDLAAMLPQGATFKAKGNLSVQPFSAQGMLHLADLKLAAAWPFLRNRLRIVEPAGSASLQATYRYESKGAAATFRVSDADLTVKDVKLATPAGPLLELASGRARQAAYDGNTGALTVQALELAHGRYTAVVDESGELNWAQLAVSHGTQRPPSRWSARAVSIKLSDIGVRYEDRSRPAPLIVDVGRGDASLALALASDAKGTRVVADEAGIELQRIAMSTAGEEALVSIGNAQVSGAGLDTGARTISANRITVSGGNAALMRNAAGDVPLFQAFATTKGAGAPAPESKAPWRYRVGEADVVDTRIALGDGGYEPALRYDLHVERLAAKNIEPEAASPVAFEAAIKVEQGGAVTASGSVAQDFSRASAKVDASGLSIKPLQGVLAKYAMLALRSGEATAAFSIDYAKDGKPMLRVGGSGKVGALAIDDTRAGQPFITWKQLAADGLTLTLAPDRLDIKEALLDAPETAIHISKDRKVNVAQVMKDSGPAAGESRRTQPQAKDEAPAFPVRVGRLRVQNGALDFSDASLVLPFSTRVTRLNGTVVGLATDAQSRAELKLGGRIEPSGYASAEGGVNLRHPTDFMDINVKFQNVEMPPLSPYTATFAGRKIAGGRLWLDLDYKITDQKLAGANRILLENVELGERVQAPNALDLPLDLAIALLKDSQGRINMAVPVTGDVGDPQFDYGSLIRDAIASAIGRIVSAPFRALASLFDGTNGEDLAKVRFTPGSARIYPPERERLQKVAKGLQSRPELKVTVHGPYDPQRDADRLKRAAVRRELSGAMGQALQAGEDAGPVALSDPQTQRAIEKLYVASNGPEALREFVAQYAKEHGPETAAPSTDQRRAYYESLYDRLVASHPLAESALQQLAAERARAITAVLTEAGVDGSRIGSGALRTVTDGGEPTVDAELELAVRNNAS